MRILFLRNWIWSDYVFKELKVSNLSQTTIWENDNWLLSKIIDYFVR